MPTKSPWEARVGMLIDPQHHSEFKYSFKPVDSGNYGGQPRIDWHAADGLGRYWMIEVKYLGPKRASLHMRRDITPGQEQALNALADTGFGVPLLAVGSSEGLLDIYDWRKIRWLCDTSKPLLTHTHACVKLKWIGPKGWKLINLYEMLKAQNVLLPNVASLPMLSPVPFIGYDPASPALGTGPTPAPSGPPWLPTPPAPSPSISKPKDSIRTRRRKLLSEQSSRR